MGEGWGDGGPPRILSLSKDPLSPSWERVEVRVAPRAS